MKEQNADLRTRSVLEVLVIRTRDDAAYLG